MPAQLVEPLLPLLTKEPDDVGVVCGGWFCQELPHALRAEVVATVHPLFDIPAKKSTAGRATLVRLGVELTQEGVGRVLDELKNDGFDYIVCDSPAGIEKGAHLAMYFSDRAVVVVNPEVSSVRDSDRILGLLSSKTQRAEKGQGPGAQHLLLTRYNPVRVEAGEMMSVGDVETSRSAWSGGATSLANVEAALNLAEPGIIAGFGEGTDIATTAKKAIEGMRNKVVERKADMDGAFKALADVKLAMQDAQEVALAQSDVEAPGPAPTFPSDVGPDEDDQIRALKLHGMRTRLHNDRVAAYDDADIKAQKALNNRQPTIMVWFVDFNAMDRNTGTFKAPPATAGHQGGHMTVLEDYQVSNVPGYGTLAAGVNAEPKALAASLDPKATIDFFRIKNSWGTGFQPPAGTDLAGYHDLYMPYLNGQIPVACTNKDAQGKCLSPATSQRG